MQRSIRNNSSSSLSSLDSLPTTTTEGCCEPGTRSRRGRFGPRRRRDNDNHRLALFCIVTLFFVCLMAGLTVFANQSMLQTNSSPEPTARRTMALDDDEHLPLAVVVHEADEAAAEATVQVSDDDEQLPPPAVVEAKPREKQHKKAVEIQKKKQAAFDPTNKVQVTANELEEQHVDFVVGGFAKCGTTTLLKSFGQHPDIAIDDKENCMLVSPNINDNVVLDRLDDWLDLVSDSDKKKGMKCPQTLKTAKTIQRLARHSPDTKFVFGLRHPVLMLQSFYNYRVTEKYFHNRTDEVIPSLTDLLQPNRLPWRDVSVDSSRYETYLMQFGKTDTTVEEMEQLSKHQNMAIKPNKFQIFVYDTNQLTDQDKERNEQFRNELQNFLELPTPFAPFGTENSNKLRYPESTDICDGRFDRERAVLMEHSIQTAAWIRDKFLQSPDVVVANRKHFVSLVNEWEVDPCLAKQQEFSTTA